MSGAPRLVDAPADVDQLRAIVTGRDRVRIRGGGTKTALSRAADVSVAALRGLVEYEPEEYTVTVRAGTPIAELAATLAAHGQYLPFDPPLVEAGATVGGTVASGLSGPGRYRHGGVRDFVIGIRFVAGDGAVVRGGGKVVKNAAGFDLPKLFVGSLGRYGVLTEVTLKVLPRPEAHATIVAEAGSLRDACAWLPRLSAPCVDPSCLDLLPDGRLFVRIDSRAAALDARVARACATVPGKSEVLLGAEDERVWRIAREFTWVAPAHGLLKVPITPRRVAACEAALAAAGGDLRRRYSVGGNVLWIAWPDAQPLAELATRLSAEGLTGQVVVGAGQWPRRPDTADPFERRVRAALDPRGVFASPATDLDAGGGTS